MREAPLYSRSILVQPPWCPMKELELFLGLEMNRYLEKESQSYMARGHSTIITIIKWTRTTRLSTKKSLSLKQNWILFLVLMTTNIGDNLCAPPNTNDFCLFIFNVEVVKTF